jgi:serine/threonine protein kinase
LEEINSGKEEADKFGIHTKKEVKKSDSKFYYIITPFYEARTLQNYLRPDKNIVIAKGNIKEPSEKKEKTKNCFPLDDNTRQLIKGLFKGIRFIHEKGYNYADVKPDNILIKMDKENKNVESLIITDFGMASKLG